MRPAFAMIAVPLTAGLVVAVPSRAQQGPDAPEAVEVTATRAPQSVELLPSTMSIISGQQLRDRGAIDLASALALVPGVEAPSGGDAGPASAVPSLLGLHEFDAFLLVVDGVPWGGAFNPTIPTLDLDDVERVEVLKGSAPVTYGATSFVGVIQVIHYPAGQSADRVQLWTGTHGETRGTLSTGLPTLGGWQQSLTLESESRGFSIDREQVADGRLLYRGSGTLAGGTVRLDLDLNYVRTTPPSPVIRTGSALTTLTPIDANYNPRDSAVDQDEYHGVLGYSHATAIGRWETTASWAFSEISDIRGFLRPDLIDDGSQNADSQRQARRIEDGYLDSHLDADLGAHVRMLYGADALYGLGKQTSINGAYDAPLSGTGSLPSTRSLHVDEINSLSDQRIFLGQYAQATWTPTPALELLGGVRLNETSERQLSTHIDGFDATSDLAGSSSRHVTRGTGMAGASDRIWRSSLDEAVLYVDYRDSFKPAAIDFGPDFTPTVLAPETAQTYEGGVRGRLFGGLLHYDASGFQVDFHNLVVATTDAAGDPIQENAGSQRLRGAELELEASLPHALSIVLDGSYHDTRFTRYVASEGGSNIDVGGNQLPLSPHWLAGVGLLYTPAEGLHGTVTLDYVGRRYLDLANTAPVGGYATVAATAGYRFGRFDLRVIGDNLSDQRPPVTASEFGDQSYYLLNGRTVVVALAARL